MPYKVLLWVMRILVVDDTVLNLQLMDAILEPAGYDVVSTESGIESINLAEKEDFDLILMDIGLPDISGTEAMLRIRNTKFGSKPVVAVTAHAMIGDKEEFESAGFDAYISKPIKIDHILEVISGLLGS